MRIYRWIPYINFSLAIPFVRISTSICYRNDLNRTFEYLYLTIEIWKWHCNLGFYETKRRRLEFDAIGFSK